MILPRRVPAVAVTCVEQRGRGGTANNNALRLAGTLRHFFEPTGKLCGEHWCRARIFM
jgi:hypothetical protein